MTQARLDAESHGPLLRRKYESDGRSFFNDVFTRCDGK
jgi:hypothetical protein